MILTLEVPTELTERLARVAAARGVPVAEYALELLESAPEPTPKSVSHPATDTDDIDPSTITTGAELVAYWRSIGAIGSRPDITDSQEYSRRLRAEIENERRGRPE